MVRSVVRTPAQVKLVAEVGLGSVLRRVEDHASIVFGCESGDHIVKVENVHHFIRKIQNAHIVLAETHLRDPIECGRHGDVCVGVCSAEAFWLAVPHLQQTSVGRTHHTVPLREDDVRTIKTRCGSGLSLNRGPFHFHFGIQLVGGGVDYGPNARQHGLGAVGVLHQGRRLVARAVGARHYGTVRLQVGGEVHGRATEQTHLDGTGVHHLHGGGVLGGSDHRYDFGIRERLQELGREERRGELGDDHRGAEAAGIDLHAIHERHELYTVHIREDGIRVQNQALRYQLLTSLALLEIQVDVRNVHVQRVG